MNSTAADCPLSWGPLTVYATLDMGLQYESNGAAWSPTQPNGTASFINKQAYGSKWLWSPNNLSQSVVGLKLSQPLPFLSVHSCRVGRSSARWKPDFSRFRGIWPTAHAPWPRTTAKRSSCRASPQIRPATVNGTIRRALSGSATRPTARWSGGRVNTLGLDGLVAYDVMSSAYAFSPFGYSGSYAGFGDTELTRSNTAFKYNWNSQNLVSWMNFHVAGIAQIGSYNQGNPSTEMWQGNIGADFPHLFAGNPFAGTLSADFIGGYAQNAVNLSNFTGTCAVTQIRRVRRSDRLHVRHPDVLRWGRPEGDAIQQFRHFPARQVQV